MCILPLGVWILLRVPILFNLSISHLCFGFAFKLILLIVELKGFAVFSNDDIHPLTGVNDLIEFYSITISVFLFPKVFSINGSIIFKFILNFNNIC